jgi:hypothetical protein
MGIEDYIVLNSIRTPDGTVLVSRDRHDFVTHEDAVTGKTYGVDGGNEYLRRIGDNDYTELSVTSRDPFEVQREAFEWGTYGKEGTEPLRWVKLKDLTYQHLTVLIEKRLGSQKSQSLFKMEVEHRKTNGITVD